MFEITLGNWMPPCRALVENVSEWFLVFSILHKVTIGFAFLAVVNGVFIQETFKVANSHDSVMLLHKVRARKLHMKKMTALFEHADLDGDGALSLREFQAVIDDTIVRTWLASQELDVSDACSLFELLDEGSDGTLTASELDQGVARLKGGAKSMEMHMVIKEIQEMKPMVEKLCNTNANADLDAQRVFREIREMRKSLEALQDTGIINLTDV